jgi:hypothetical protein
MGRAGNRRHPLRQFTSKRFEDRRPLFSHGIAGVTHDLAYKMRRLVVAGMYHDASQLAERAMPEYIGKTGPQRPLLEGRIGGAVWNRSGRLRQREPDARGDKYRTLTESSANHDILAAWVWIEPFFGDMQKTPDFNRDRQRSEPIGSSPTSTLDWAISAFWGKNFSICKDQSRRLKI